MLIGAAACLRLNGVAWWLLWLPALTLAEKVALEPTHWGLPAGQQCVSCHAKTSAGLTQQWRDSAHARAGVNCLDCHQAKPEDIDAVEHEGQLIATIVSPRDCGRCHGTEWKEQEGSVHANAVALMATRLPALANQVAGEAIIHAGCAQCHGAVVKFSPSAGLDADTWPNSGIGRINPDGSKGACSACHGRHAFSKAQARDPSACARCHSGPDSPDQEIYQASKHGMLFAAHKDAMNLTSDAWIAGRDYAAAPTCVTCHMGAASGVKPSHDVGMRNAWNLNTPVSEQQHLVIFEDGDKRDWPAVEPLPAKGSEARKQDGTLGKVKSVASAERRRQVMTMVCLECHAQKTVTAFMRQFDEVVKLYNDKFGDPARAIMAQLYERKLLTPTPFDEPIEFTYWELWHDEGARARHGAAMASPNHSWWEGLYLVGRNFYSRFVPQVMEVAGPEQGKALIDALVLSSDRHQWLKEPQRSNPILGYGAGAGHD